MAPDDGLAAASAQVPAATPPEPGTQAAPPTPPPAARQASIEKVIAPTAKPSSTPTPDAVVMRVATAMRAPRATPSPTYQARQPKRQYGAFVALAGLLLALAAYVVLVARQRATRRAGLVLGEESEPGTERPDASR